MSSLTVKLGLLAAGLMLSGCMQATTYEATNVTNFKPRDKELLAKVSYAKVPVAEPFRRAIVDYHRKEAPGSIVVDSDNHYLYLVQKDGKAIRYGITVGEEAMAWSGIAKVGSKTEWPPWHPTPGEISRLGVPKFVAPGPDVAMQEHEVQFPVKKTTRVVFTVQPLEGIEPYLGARAHLIAIYQDAVTFVHAHADESQPFDGSFDFLARFPQAGSYRAWVQFKYRGQVITRDVCLACIPDIALGEFVLVHVGFAISKVDKEEAARAYATLQELGLLAELTSDAPQPEQPP